MNAGKTLALKCPACGKTMCKSSYSFSCTCPNCGTEMVYDPKALKAVLLDLVRKRENDPESSRAYAMFLDSPDRTIRELADDILYRYKHNLPLNEPDHAAEKNEARSGSESKPRKPRSSARTNSNKSGNNSSGKSDGGKDTSQDQFSPIGCGCVSLILSAAAITGLAVSVHLTWWSLFALVPALGGVNFLATAVGEFWSRKNRDGFFWLLISLDFFVMTYIWLVCGFWTCLWSTPLILILGLFLAELGSGGGSGKKVS